MKTEVIVENKTYQNLSYEEKRRVIVENKTYQNLYRVRRRKEELLLRIKSIKTLFSEKELVLYINSIWVILHNKFMNI